MIILDTNVIAEAMKATQADPKVWRWLQRLQQPTWITAMSVSEILFGIRRLPAGQRRNSLDQQGRLILKEFRDSIATFDADAAYAHADLLVTAQKKGRSISTVDSQIAAVCLVRGATLATRNTKDFAHTGVSLIDPWKG